MAASVILLLQFFPELQFQLICHQRCQEEEEKADLDHHHHEKHTSTTGTGSAVANLIINERPICVLSEVAA
ncbi:hypothetical protein TYRP_016188 [Tyrophagus putrescentiae]|nr:hypothetical protein TYRP_016188 [Tyrophagus putrescentiae]